ncbi:hypothetical protein CLM62_24250 [Streptomyces sp. SA15]|uniref:hypothetical protein n=1 Tax=Streptomyces sp. SA15 TaxID=934019 RepID=UPI000BB056C5|nr:hypothetical protein [Streptomyces sp. SA15]PAZ13482.1 hypothetical protein CLM62_24250 [Streptomyces sp. SA15]
MEAIAASVIAVVGTLLGVTVTHYFQGRALKRTEGFARDERLRQERLQAYSAYAGALVSYRRVLVARWSYEHEPGHEDDNRAAQARSDDLRSQAEQTLFRVEMLAGGDEIRRQAREAFKKVSEVHKTDDACEHRRRRAQTNALIQSYVVASRRDVG